MSFLRTDCVQNLHGICALVNSALKITAVCSLPDVARSHPEINFHLHTLAREVVGPVRNFSRLPVFRLSLTKSRLQV